MNTSSPSKKRKSADLQEQTAKKRRLGKYKLPLSPVKDDHKQKNSHEEELAEILDRAEGYLSSDDSYDFYVDRDPPAADDDNANNRGFQRTPVEIADQLRAEKEQLANRVSELTQSINHLSTINEGLSREVARAPDPRDMADLHEELKTVREALQAVRNERDELIKTGLDVLDSEETTKLRTENKLLTAHVNRLAKDNSKLELKCMELQNLADVSEAEHLDYMKRTEKDLKEKEEDNRDLRDRVAQLKLPTTVAEAAAYYDISTDVPNHLPEDQVVLVRPLARDVIKYRLEFWPAVVTKECKDDDNSDNVQIAYAEKNPWGGFMPFGFNFKKQDYPTQVIDRAYIFGTASRLPVDSTQRRLFMDACNSRL